MTPSISPDLKQNIITTIYLLFSHNHIAIAYLTGMIICIGLSIYKPSRFTILLFLGFLILLFAFEYDKHIINGLREQTTTSLITIQQHNRVRKIINLIISQLLPLFLYILGWGLIYIAIITAAIKLGKKNKQ